MYRNNNRAIISAVVELFGAYFGLAGLGWMIGGDVIRGLLVLVGYWVFLAVGGFLVAVTFGLLGLIFVPLYIILPIISAFKVYEFVNSRWW